MRNDLRTGTKKGYMFSFFSKYLSTDLAIDLGTANTLIYVRGRRLEWFF